MITNEKMAVNTAKRLVDFLNSKGIKAESDFTLRPVRKTLRECWYVKKLVEYGKTDCIHIGLPDCGGFFAVTDDCKVMSGKNIMICDALECIFCDYIDGELDWWVFESINAKFSCDEGGDCGIFFVEPTRLISFLDSLDYYE